VVGTSGAEVAGASADRAGGASAGVDRGAGGADATGRDAAAAAAVVAAAPVVRSDEARPAAVEADSGAAPDAGVGAGAAPDAGVGGADAAGGVAGPDTACSGATGARAGAVGEGASEVTGRESAWRWTFAVGAAESGAAESGSAPRGSASLRALSTGSAPSARPSRPNSGTPTASGMPEAPPSVRDGATTRGTEGEDIGSPAGVWRDDAVSTAASPTISRMISSSIRSRVLPEPRAGAAVCCDASSARAAAVAASQSTRVARAGIEFGVAVGGAGLTSSAGGS